MIRRLARATSTNKVRKTEVLIFKQVHSKTVFIASVKSNSLNKNETKVLVPVVVNVIDIRVVT